MNSVKFDLKLKKILLVVCTILILGIVIFISFLLTENKKPSLGLGQPNIAQVTPLVATVSVDDDPILGNANAPITIVEFSDYECPFCKKYFIETFPKIKAKYIDSGKVKLVFRDLPLSLHDPLATKEAVAANCAKQQGGDIKYFSYHDQLFKLTASNGNGLNDENLKEIATDVGLDLNQFELCTKDSSMKAEVMKDLEDAQKAGANSTPTFIIGKSQSDGVIRGNILVGAQPFSVFEVIIDSLLK